MSNSSPGLDQRLVEPDVRRTQRPAPAGHEAERRAVDEAEQPLDVLRRIERDVVVHGDRAPAQPARGPRDRRVVRMQEDEPARLGEHELGDVLLQPVGIGICRVHADAQHQIGVTDRLLRPRRQLGVGDEDEIVVLALELVEELRRLGAVERDPLGEELLGLGRVDDEGHRRGRGECIGELPDEFGRNCRFAGADERNRARPRIAPLWLRARRCRETMR